MAWPENKAWLRERNRKRIYRENTPPNGNYAKHIISIVVKYEMCPTKMKPGCSQRVRDIECNFPKTSQGFSPFGRNQVPWTNVANMKLRQQQQQTSDGQNNNNHNGKLSMKHWWVCGGVQTMFWARDTETHTHTHTNHIIERLRESEPTIACNCDVYCAQDA